MPGLAYFPFGGRGERGERSILLNTISLGPQARSRTRACLLVGFHPSPPGRSPVGSLGSGEFRFVVGGLGQRSLLGITSVFSPVTPHGQKSKHELSGCAVWPGLFSKYRNNLDENVVLRWISEDEAINVSHPSLQGSPRGLLI